MESRNSVLTFGNGFYLLGHFNDVISVSYPFGIVLSCMEKILSALLQNNYFAFDITNILSLHKVSTQLLLFFPVVGIGAG